MMARLPVLAAVVGLVLAVPAADALADLHTAKAARATALADAAGGTPGPLAMPDAAFPADDARDARVRLAARVRAAAVRGGVLVEGIDSDPAVPGALAALTLRASGPEKAMLAFVDTLERGRDPAVRLRGWRLVPVSGGIRIEARLVAPWRG